MTNGPTFLQRVPDLRRFAAATGAASALAGLAVCGGLRLTASLDRAAYDRVATALGDTPVSTQLLVIRVPSRTGDSALASAALRLDSAGARVIGIAVDLSVPVAPTGVMPDLLTLSRRVMLGATVAGQTITEGASAGVTDSVLWPWFLTDSARRVPGAMQRIGRTALLRDDDGVVRRTTVAPVGETWLATELAVQLSGIAGVRPGMRDERLLQFGRTDTLWFGLRSMTIERALTGDLTELRRAAGDATVLLGVDDGNTIPTSVGAMPALAILGHEVASRARIADGTTRALSPARAPWSAAWLLVWVAAGAVLAAALSLRNTLMAGALGVVVIVILVLWLAASGGVLMPMGSAVLVFALALLSTAMVTLWQVRRKEQLTALLFSRFVTPALAADAWNARHLYLEGARPAPIQLPVTVLFIDLRGFTRFSEARPPADVMRFITEVTAACATDIAAHGGLVDDFAGDGIKADFGVPVPRTTAGQVTADAWSAVRCACALARTIVRLVPADHGTDGALARIGIHSGTAVAGTVGGGSRLKYTVVGDVVNVAARLQSLDIPSRELSGSRCPIVVSAATMALLGDNPPHAIDLGCVSLTGRAQPVHAFRVVPDSDQSPALTA